MLAVNYSALDLGSLPCGLNGLKGRLEIQRLTNPLGLRLLFFVDTAAGLTLIIYAIRLLAGWALPLPLSQEKQMNTSEPSDFFIDAAFTLAALGFWLFLGVAFCAAATRYRTGAR